MARPVFLVVELEQPDGLSTRKLVLETAKYNVLTAHSGKEGLEVAAAHPVDAMVVHHGMRDVAVPKLVKQLKDARPTTPVILLVPNGGGRRVGVDHVVSSHDPAELVRLLAGMFGKPPDAQLEL